jgi:predicted MFS family arabinose efflux permease
VLGGTLIWGVAYSSIALATPNSPISVPLLAALLGATGTINPIAGANAATLRHALAPPRLLGRIIAVSRVAQWGGVALGSLLGGVLADTFGVRSTVMLSGLLPLAGGVWLLLSPVRRVRSLDSVEPPCSEES